MATQNAIKLTEAGIASYDGSGIFAGTSLIAGSGISIDDPGVGDIIITSSIDEFVWITDGLPNPKNNTGYIPVTSNVGPIRVYGLNRIIHPPFVGFTFAVQGLPGGINWAVAGVLGANLTFNGVIGTRISSTNPTDGAEFVCTNIIAGNQSFFTVRSSTGNLIVSTPT